MGNHANTKKGRIKKAIQQRNPFLCQQLITKQDVTPTPRFWEADDSEIIIMFETQVNRNIWNHAILINNERKIGEFTTKPSSTFVLATFVLVLGS